VAGNGCNAFIAEDLIQGRPSNAVFLGHKGKNYVIILGAIKVNSTNKLDFLKQIIDQVNKELNDNVAIVAVSEDLMEKIQGLSVVHFEKDGNIHVTTADEIDCKVIYIDKKAKFIDVDDLPEDCEFKEEVRKIVGSMETVREIIERWHKHEVIEEPSLAWKIFDKTKTIVSFIVVPLLVIASLFAMPFRKILGKKFRFRGKETSLKDAFSFFEGLYNLFLSIESIPEGIVRKRLKIKSKVKVDITERGKRLDYMLNKYITQILDNSLGIVAGFILIQQLDTIKAWIFIAIDWFKGLTNSGVGMFYQFLEEHQTTKEILLMLWTSLYVWFIQLATIATDIWINYLSWIAVIVIDFLKEHPISLAAVILILASSGISGLLNATADGLFILALPVKILYKIFQLAHYGIVRLYHRALNAPTIATRIGYTLLAVVISVIYAPFFVIYFVLGVIILVIEVIRSAFRGLARVFDALPIYRVVAWAAYRAPMKPHFVEDNGIAKITVKRKGIKYIIEDYLESFKTWWIRNNPRLVAMRFLYGRIKEPPMVSPPQEELTVKERIILLKASLGLGTITDEIRRKLET